MHSQNKPKVVAYIDGFNLYYGVRCFKDEPRLKWCDVKKLMSGFLDRNDTLAAVKFYTARPKPAMNLTRAGTTEHFTTYTDALKSIGVKVIEGKFKDKTVAIPIDRILHPDLINKRVTGKRIEYKTYEEKETDVHLGVDLVSDAYQNLYDKALVVSADTDLLPALRCVLNYHSEKHIKVIAPPKQHLKDIKKNLAPRYPKQLSIGKIGKARLIIACLPDEIQTADGATIKIPADYQNGVK